MGCQTTKARQILKTMEQQGIIKAINAVDNKKVVPYLKKIRNGINDSKIINKACEFISKFPSPLRDIGRGTAELAPLLVIGTQIGHLFGHQKVKAQVASRNYDELKQAQQNIRENIADEKINKHIRKKTINELYADYEQMLKTKPVIDAQTKEPITFEQYVKLATTYVK